MKCLFAILSVFLMFAGMLPREAKAESYYRWRLGSCYEMTPSGSIIRNADSDYCRNSPYASLNQVLRQLAALQDLEKGVNHESRDLKRAPAVESERLQTAEAPASEAAT